MRALYAETARGVYMRLPGFYAERGKYYIVEDEILAVCGEPVRFDLVIERLAEEFDLPLYLFERVKTRSDR